MSPLPWFRKMGGASTARARLVCLPPAGGGTARFASWPAAFPGLEVFALQLPARERLLAEPPVTRMEDLLERALPELVRLLDRPAAIFGHSMGALVGYSFCRALARRGAPPPALLVASGSLRPDRLQEGTLLYRLSDQELIDQIRRLGGTPEAVLADRELMEIILVALRADLVLSEAHDYGTLEALDCPLAAYGGAADPDLSERALDAWAGLTSRGFRRRIFPGGHHYLDQEAAPVFAALREDFRALASL
ncbi:MAG TPA: thioesterase domain-containing protein [Myxococcales bacterium]|nr:thioesterase domain-containing protein [Myxococcales bacterium]